MHTQSNLKTTETIPVQGSIRIVQLLPGRIGLRIRAVKDAPDYANEVKQSLESIQGVMEVDINVLTGNVLITYNPDQFSDEQCVNLVEKLTHFFPNLDSTKLAACLNRPH